MGLCGPLVWYFSFRDGRVHAGSVDRPWAVLHVALHVAACGEVSSRLGVLIVVHAQMHAGRLDVLTSSSVRWKVSVVLSVLWVWVLAFGVSF